jgi:asparagine synthase (glutamine-hydrolysing)
LCGIAGFVGEHVGRFDPAERLRAMCDAIMHRGPDSAGYLLEPNVAMGMRRLSIIDVAGGTQPIFNEDGSVGVVFNGEIYNHGKLRSQLQAKGHRFATRSDTEVLVHLYEEYGRDMAAHLQGMFAFAIWDKKNCSLLISRDRAGMKPLSYMETSRGLIFCSELRSVYAFDPSYLAISEGSIMQYLAFGYVPEPNSIFLDVKKLPAGHSLTWNAGDGVVICRYWQVPSIDSSLNNENEIVDTMRDLLDRAIASHLESEVPLGAFLSGGLDSSTVVALMCRHASGRVRTFSIGFHDPKYDESAAARRVAHELGTEHTELIVAPDVEAIFSCVAEIFDEPFGDSSAIPTLLVSQLARKQVTVALSGDGGDELFGGYTRYSEALSHSRLPAPIAPVLRALGTHLPHATLGRNRIIDMGRSRRGRYASTVLLPLRTDEGGVASRHAVFGRRRVDDLFNDVVGTDDEAEFAATIMQMDFQTYLPGDILTKVDRTSMAVSLESRVPLLDADLTDFALKIPGALRVNANETKRLFRRAIRGIVPEFVLSREKQGFAIPLGNWFRGPLRHRVDALRAGSKNIDHFLDHQAMDRQIDEHLVSRRDHSAMLWRIMVLDQWLAAFYSGRYAKMPALPRLA